MTVEWNDRRTDRREDRLRSLGTREPRCSQPGCPEANPFALTGAHPNILCFEHLAEQRGRSTLDGHHAAGRHNDPEDIVKVPANDHAVLTHDLQALWPQATLRNPTGSPLLKAAAALRGWLDVLVLILERTVGWIPNFLEVLDAYLAQVLGDRWWDGYSWIKE